MGSCTLWLLFGLMRSSANASKTVEGDSMAQSACSANGGQILAYFSHSYREADREVNSFFWELFSEQGFFFTVDPQSEFFSIPYLEAMMTLSNCFVAVITKRAGMPRGCSPYILFEYGLAMQAQKPCLVFVEQGLSGKSFPHDEERVLAFNRQRLNDHKRFFSAAIGTLADKVRGYRNPDVRLTRPAGLLIDAERRDIERVYTPQLIQRLTTEMEKNERSLEIVPVDFQASFEFCLELEKYDFLILEAREGLQAPWLAGYVLGRAIPCIKLLHLAAGETPDSVALPPIIARHKPDQTKEDPVVYWHDQQELLQGVMKHVAKFGTERIEFHTREDGLRYFRRAGRRRAHVFISNAGASNPLAHKVIAGLRLESMDFFHYQAKDAIPVGEKWLAVLEDQIEQSGIFVALLGEDYLSSPWCRYELQVALKRAAEGRLKIHPYVLNRAVLDRFDILGISELQALDLSGSEEQAIVKEIIENVDKELKGEPPLLVGRVSAAGGAPPPTSVRGLSLTEEDRRRLVEILAARLTTEDGQRPAWIKGMLMRASLYAHLAGEDYGGGAASAATTLVTKAEALGVLPSGQRPVLLVVRCLLENELVSHEHAPFLRQLAERLERGASTE